MKSKGVTTQMKAFREYSSSHFCNFYGQRNMTMKGLEGVLQFSDCW